MTATRDVIESVEPTDRSLSLRSRRFRFTFDYWMLVLPAIVFLLIIFAYPVARILMRSLSYPEWGLHNFGYLLERPIYARVMINTVQISAVVTIATLLIAYPYAYVMAGAKPHVQKLMVFAVLVPFWTSTLVRSYAWLVLLQNRGLVNEFLVGTGVLESPLTMIHNRTGTYIGMIQVLLPFMIFPLFAVMVRIDRSYGQAAANLGASPFQSFRRVFFPMSLPGVGAGVLLVFVLSIGFFITPALLGGPRDIMIAQLIQQQVSELGNWGIAGALSVVLLGTTLLLFVVFDRVFGIRNAQGSANV